METKTVLKREGRDAKNLVAYQICEDISSHKSSAVRKPPVIPKSQINVTLVKKQSPTKGNNGHRVRSASTGRDKKSELQARYWALLFGNLQRAVNEIYQTVECYENMSSCQEAILVLENYIRDFKALAEWFRVSWNYELTPLPQRSLAWEIRKSNPSNPVPRIRAKSLSSPVVSGKSSPNFSGKSSPCSTIEEGKNTPKKCTILETSKTGTTRVNIRELFSSKNNKKPTDSTNPSELVYLQVNEKKDKLSPKANKELSWTEMIENETRDSESLNSLNQVNDTEIITEKCDQYVQTDLEDENLTLAEIREKLLNNVESKPNSANISIAQEPTAVELTVLKLNSMEDAEISRNLYKPSLTVDSEIKKFDASNPIKSEILSAVKPVEPLKKTQNLVKATSVINKSSVSGLTNKSAVLGRNTTLRSSRIGCSTQPLQKPVSSNSVGQSNNTNASNASVKKLSVKATAPNLARQKNSIILNRNSSNLVKSDRWMPPSNVANRLMAGRSVTMIDINEKINRQKRSQILSLSSRKSSRDDLCSSNSTLKASNEKIDGSKFNVNDINKNGKLLDQNKRSEPNDTNSGATNNDGWLTVKTRRRSSLHWANRFNQPTGYASLPTLALLNEKEEFNNNDLEGNKEKKVNKEKNIKQQVKNIEVVKSDETNKSVRPETKNIKSKISYPSFRTSTTKETGTGQLKSARDTNKNNESTSKEIDKKLVSRQSIIKRQKSDLTGLKITSLHREYMRSEKYNNKTILDPKSGIKKIRTPECLSEREKTESLLDDSDQNKIDIKIQTNREFSKTIGDLYESLANIPNGIRDIGLSSCDEYEEKEENESDEDQRKLLEEQESLERQIRELQNTEIDVDTETDETDCEVMIDYDDNNEEQQNQCQFEDDPLFVNDENISLELRYQSLLSEMSWGEREEALATLQAYVSRHPGRAQELHQKLSSPSRRRSLHETLKKYQAKQARAQQKRELLQKEKALKIQQLLARVEDVKSAKFQLIEEKRLRMEERLQRAAENRNQYLRDIVRKAHDEEEKLKEIAFIKILEAQNKRLDFIESCKEHEGRLQDLEQERQKRVEEKAAKEAAVERRRQELEQARKRRLEKMNETRLEREQRVGKMQEQRERQRQAIAREKARDREERLLALQVQKQQSTEELQRKIIQKQKESARRHEENIEQIRQRALELTIPSRNVDDNGTVPLENDNFEDELSSTVSDLSKEYTKGFKKKMKKIKQRMAQSTEEYLKDLQSLPLHMKRESLVPKFLNLVSKGGGTQGLERQLGQLLRVMAKAQINDFQCFWLMDGLGIIANVISQGMKENSEVTKRSVTLAVQLYRNACTLCPQISRHSLLGNSVTTLFDALLQSVQLPEEKSPQHPVELSTELMLASTVALSPSNSKRHTHPKIIERIPDLISYAVTTGLIEVLSRRCMKIRESVENYQSVILSLLATIGLLTKFVDMCPQGYSDTTKFLTAAKSTELFGSISMLYSSVVPIGECIPPRTISLSAATFNLLVSMAVLSLSTFQEILSKESPLSMKYLDVITILLKYCGNQCTSKENSETQAVIVDLIATIGFFCANNKNNQNLLISDQCSVIIKSLSRLPEHLNIVIYPCLITIIYKNEQARNIIAKDFNLQMLDEYSKSEIGQKNRLVAILAPGDA